MCKDRFHKDDVLAGKILMDAPFWRNQLAGMLTPLPAPIPLPTSYSWGWPKGGFGFV